MNASGDAASTRFQLQEYDENKNASEIKSMLHQRDGMRKGINVPFKKVEDKNVQYEEER